MSGDSGKKDVSVPTLEKVVNLFEPMAKNWGVNLPDNVEILTTYGGGGSYNWGKNPKIIFRMDRFDEAYTTGLLQHEFVHILVEGPIIQKYKVPQDLKERIVDVICFEYFGKPVQKSFENSFAKPYITKESINKDLPGTVKKMMMDYQKIQTNTNKNSTR